MNEYECYSLSSIQTVIVHLLQFLQCFINLVNVALELVPLIF